jgi:hypothetical protein
MTVKLIFLIAALCAAAPALAQVSVSSGTLSNGGISATDSRVGVRVGSDVRFDAGIGFDDSNVRFDSNRGVGTGLDTGFSAGFGAQSNSIGGLGAPANSNAGFSIADIPSNSTDRSLPIFFDAFLSDNGGVPADNFNAFFQWNVTGGSVDLAGQPVVDPFGSPVVEFDERGGPVFGRFVDLAGSTGVPGVFATRFSFPFLGGATYNLSFDFSSASGNPSTATVAIGPLIFTVSTNSTSFSRFSQNFSFDSTTIARLVFQGQGGEIGIDNVILVAR